ncbi:MAG: SOS response-associated peptidase [Hyphomicrobiales bacterium]|nr:SOS response-associated peptidase [Hyphomicrobiales bacterium]
MCYRYSQLRAWSDLVSIYRITADVTPLNLQARYNLAPTQDVPIVRQAKDSTDRELLAVRWGLVPFWAKDIKIGYSLINARAETVDSKPSFRQAFRQRRCLIPANGFYEWQSLDTRNKQPYYITLPDERPFAFAGLWESWTSLKGEVIESCTIIVTAANAQLRPVHDRMPVMLEPERFEAWLDTGAPLKETRSLLRPYDGQLAMYPVSQHVNSVRHDDPQCAEPLQEGRERAVDSASGSLIPTSIDHDRIA